MRPGRVRYICHQIPFDYPAAIEHEPGVSRQTLWTTASNMDFGKMSSGDGKDCQIAALHNNVSTHTPAVLTSFFLSAFLSYDWSVHWHVLLVVSLMVKASYNFLSRM